MDDFKKKILRNDSSKDFTKLKYKESSIYANAFMKKYKINIGNNTYINNYELIELNENEIKNGIRFYKNIENEYHDTIVVMSFSVKFKEKYSQRINNG